MSKIYNSVLLLFQDFQLFCTYCENNFLKPQEYFPCSLILLSRQPSSLHEKPDAKMHRAPVIIRYSCNLLLLILNNRITKRVRKGIYGLFRLTHAAAVRIICSVIGQVRNGKERLNRNTHHAVRRAENCTDAADRSTVLPERTHGANDSLSGRHRRKKQQDIFPLHHGL